MSLHTMPVNVGDLLRDTQDLNAEQFGAYHALLYALWGGRGVLSSDPQTLCRIARIQARRWPAVWAKLERYFAIEGGELRQNRVTKTLTKVSEKVAKNRANAKRGGDAKARKDKERSLANAKANGTEKTCQSKPNSPNGETSEAKASEAAPREDVWSIGRPMLERTGMTGKEAGSALGMLIKRKGEAEALAIVIGMRAKPPMNPGEYVWGIIQGRQAPESDPGAAPSVELVIVDGKPTVQPTTRRAA